MKEKILEALVNELNQCHETIFKCASSASGSVAAGLAPHMAEVARQIGALAGDESLRERMNRIMALLSTEDGREAMGITAEVTGGRIL